MQIFEAAQEFTGKYHPRDSVWFVKYDDLRCQYFIVRNAAYDPLDRLSREDKCITKQRGGVRFYSSLDVVVKAIRQIGQSKFEINL